MKKYIYSLLVLAMTAFTFSSCEDVPAPYDTPNKPETPDVNPGVATGTGTAEDPFNSIAAIAYCQSLEAGVESEQDVYVKGKVQSIKEEFGGYGNGSFYIADDENSTTFYVYRALYLGNKKWTSSDDQIKVGDEVVVCGKVVNYSGNTPETVQNKAYLVSLNGKTAGGDTPDTPTDGYINETFGSSFGSFTLKEVKGTPWIIDSYGYAKATGYDNTSKTTTPSESYIVSKAIDLSASTGATLSFSYILRYVTNSGTAVEGVKNQVLITENYTGDPATTTWTDITGSLVEGTDWKTWQTYTKDLSAYKGKKNIVIALHYACEASSGTWEVKNLTVKDGGSSETPDTPDTPSTSDGISIDGTTVTLTNASVTAGESIKVEDISTLSPAANPASITLSDGTVLAFDANGNKTKPAFNANYNELRLYANNKMTITASKNIAKIILTCSVYNGVNEVGNETATVAFSGKTVTYTNVFTGTSGGGVQLRIKAIEIVYAK